MTPRRAIVAGLGVLCMFAGVLWATWPKTSANDEAAIQVSLEAVADAARRGRVDEIMGLVSRDFRAGGLDKRRLRLLLVRSRASGRPGDWEVHLSPLRFLPADPKKPGLRAVATRISVFETLGGETLWGGDDTIFLVRRETRRHLWWFPVEQWRIVGVPALPPLPGSID